MSLSRDQDSLTAELPYWVIRDGLVLLADGTYEVGVEAQLPTSSLWTAEAVNALNMQIRTLLRHAVPEGERLRVMIEVGPYDERVLAQHRARCCSGHPTVQMLAEARLRQLRRAQERRQLVNYRMLISCTWHPRDGTRRRPWTPVDPQMFVEHRTRARLVRQVILANLDRAGVHARPLSDTELLAAIWRYFNPERRGRGETPPLPQLDFEAPPELLARFPHLSRPTVRSQVLGSDVGRRWNHLWVDDHYAMVVSMDQLPSSETHVGMLQPLLEIPCWFWLVLDFVHDPYGQAIRALETQARRLYSVSTDEAPITDYVDPRVRVGLDDADTGLQHAYSSGSHLFRVGASVVILARDLETVRASAHRTLNAFGQLHGVKAVMETAGLWHQFVALAPCSGRVNERLYRAFEENAADFFPTAGPWAGAGDAVCLFWNQWDSLVALDPFDPRAGSWNAIVAGASGAGKTFFVQSLLTQLVGREVEVVIVDRGGGYTWLTRALGGQVISIDPASGVSINPFDLPDGTAVPPPEKKAFLLALLRAILNTDHSDESAETAILEAAVEQTYARATTERRDALTGEISRTFDGTRLSDLITTLVTMEDLGDRSLTSHERDLARRLSSRLLPWTGESTFGQLLDRPTNVQFTAPILYFETTGLTRHPELHSVVVLLLGDLIWRRVQEHPDRRKIVVFDEAWALLKIPQAAQFIGELYRRFRRYGAAIYTITQSLGDFLGDGAKGILESTTYHFLLQLPQELDLAARLFGLGDRARDVLARLSVRKGVYSEVLAWVRYDDKPIGDVLIIRPTPEEYWLFTSFDRDSLVRTQALQDRGGDVMAAVQQLAAAWPAGTAPQPAEEVTRA